VLPFWSGEFLAGSAFVRGFWGLPFEDCPLSAAVGVLLWRLWGVYLGSIWVPPHRVGPPPRRMTGRAVLVRCIGCQSAR
jgi:hypothetical protein